MLMSDKCYSALLDGGFDAHFDAHYDTGTLGAAHGSLQGAPWLGDHMVPTCMQLHVETPALPDPYLHGYISLLYSIHIC